MTLRVIEGFDNFDVDDISIRGWTTTSNVAYRSSVAGYEGGSALKCTETSNFTKGITSTSNSVIIGAYFKHTNGLATADIFKVYNDSGSQQCYVRMNSSGQIVVMRHNAVAITSYSDAVISLNTWHHIEWKINVHNSTATTEVRVDGVSILTATGLDTLLSGGSNIETVDLYVSGGNDTIFDHFYIIDVDATAPNDFLGPVIVKSIYPDGDATPNDFTATGTGTTNADRVDEASQDGDTTYVAATTAADKDLYTVESMPSGLSTIHGVQVSSITRKDGGDTKTMRNYVDSGGTVSNGSTYTLTESYATKSDVYAVDPDTSAAWTETAVNALKIGVEVVS